MDISQHLRGAFLRAADLDEGDVVTTITGTGSKEFDDGARILLETEFGTVVLNKTNLKEIAGAFGSDTDRWTGRSVKLCKEKTNFSGKKVDCIRIYVETPKEIRPVRDTRKETRPAPTIKPVADEDIPF